MNRKFLRAEKKSHSKVLWAH